MTSGDGPTSAREGVGVEGGGGGGGGMEYGSQRQVKHQLVSQAVSLSTYWEYNEPTE